MLRMLAFGGVWNAPEHLASLKYGRVIVIKRARLKPRRKIEVSGPPGTITRQPAIRLWSLQAATMIVYSVQRVILFIFKVKWAWSA